MTAGKKTSVFIVDDSEMERTMLKDYLSKYADFEIKTFSNGEYCVREIITGNVQEPNLVIMDYFLDVAPGSAKDGVEILKKLKEVAPDAKVIMLTSVNNERIIDLAKKNGALDYVVKGATGYQQLEAALEKHGLLNKVAQN